MYVLLFFFYSYKTEEKCLLQLIDNLKKERSNIEGTVVQLESYVEPPAPQPLIPSLARKLDLETAVLIEVSLLFLKHIL